mmetsp:Transcript_9481/g.14386  ORF Transcript_9481/g.14386 Transcript_9481/m.14386 type:complete len:88 (+) Transcript_9481:38-301(+)
MFHFKKEKFALSPRWGRDDKYEKFGGEEKRTTLGVGTKEEGKKEGEGERRRKEENGKGQYGDVKEGGEDISTTPAKTSFANREFLQL